MADKEELPHADADWDSEAPPEPDAVTEEDWVLEGEASAVPELTAEGDWLSLEVEL